MIDIVYDPVEGVVRVTFRHDDELMQARQIRLALLWLLNRDLHLGINQRRVILSRIVNDAGEWDDLPEEAPPTPPQSPPPPVAMDRD